MEELEASNANTNDVKRLTEQFAKEKNDIVCGFLKEKELIEMMHSEEVNGLVAKYEQEKEFMRRQFESEKEDLLQGFQTQQVDKINEFQRERENLETKTIKKFQSKARNLEEKSKEERLKMRREYEEIIAEKNEEIKMLRRELLRVEHQENRLARNSPDDDIYITRIKHDEELGRIAENFESEKLELERKFDREKAELVQVFANQTERMNENFDRVKQRMKEDHEKELEFKLEITEKLLSEKAEYDMKRMVQQFEREITELQKSLEIGYNERLFEKQQTIDDLEKEKKELLNALQTERFSLARVYNREMSLLTKPDPLTKEDVEVALIDEIAKLKQQYEDALTEMEGQHKQKLEVVKKNQRPMRELELQHRKEMEKLKKNFEHEKESLEAEFRKEQLNLLKSFEFERNDLEQRYEEIINERELEIQQREEDLRRLYVEELDELKSIVAKQREELEVSKQKLTDLADQTEEFLSEKNRIEEKFQKENSQCQSLEQTMEKNVRTFEKNMEEVEAFHQKELAKKAEELARRNALLQQLETEKLELQKETETLKARLEEFQMASENVINANSEEVLESALVDIKADLDEPSGTIVDDETKLTGTKSPLEEGKGEEEMDQEQETQTKEKERVNECLHKIRERLRKCIPEEEQLKSVEDLQMSNKQMKDAINQEIVEIDKLCGNKDKVQEEDVSVEEESTFSLDDQLQAVDNILTEGDTDRDIDKRTKDQLNEKLKEILKKAHRLHEFEKLKLKKEQQEQFCRLLKELADEKRKELQESIKDLQDADKIGDRPPKVADSKATEERGTSTDDLEDPSSARRDKKETGAELVDELRREKEEMKRLIDELEKSFTKEKGELLEKLQTQHKEFVMSTEGEIIENLLKQKTILEEAFNLERFYLSRLYYLEMKEELEDILCRRKEKMKQEFDRDKMNIILKYESDIADLHRLLSEKDDMELRLLQDRNDAMKKLLATQTRSTPEKGKRERKKERRRFERDRDSLEVTIPLKKEIADLQNKRHQEHETAVAILKDAIDLIKNIMFSSPLTEQKGDDQFDRLSFLSEDPMRSLVTSPVDKPREGGLNPRKSPLISDEEIRNRDELRDALENLVEIVLNGDEDSVYDSETTSGASSDLESDDSSPPAANGESDEGAFSGPESADGDMLSIKKAQLDFAFNLERFNLGRVYYGEYRDSLRKAMKKLAKSKETLRSKRKDLEDDMLSGIKALVNRTRFGEKYSQVSKRDIDTQTAEEAVRPEDRSEDGTDGKQLPKVKNADNEMESLTEDDGGLIDSQEDLENDQEEQNDQEDKNKGHFPYYEKRQQETASQFAREEPHTGYENAPVAGAKEPRLKEDKDEVSHVQEQDTGLSRIEEEKQDEYSNLDDNNRGGRQRGCSPFQDSGNEEEQGSTKNESDSEAEIKGEDTSFEKPHEQDIQRPMEEGEKVSRTNKGDQKDDAAKYAKEEKGTEDLDELETIKVDVRGFSVDKPQEESLKHMEECEKDHISHEKAVKDVKEEDLDDNDIPKVGGEISPKEKYEDDTDKDGTEFEKDIITTGGAEKDRSFSKDKTQEEPNRKKEEYEMEHKDIEENIPEDTKTVDNKGTPIVVDQIFPVDKSQDKEEYKKDHTDSSKGDNDTKENMLEDNEHSGDMGVQKVGENISLENGNENEPTEIETSKVEKTVVPTGDEALKSLKDETVTSRKSKKDNKNGNEREENAELELKLPYDTTPADPSDANLKYNTPVDSLKDDETLAANEEEDLEKSHDKKDKAEFDRLSQMSESNSQKDEEEEDLGFQSRGSPISDQDLIKQLNKNNKTLQDKFNLLRELVGKGFVNAIPELSDDKKSEDPVAPLESISELYAEKELLANELKQVDSQMKELSGSGSDNVRDRVKQLEDEESEILHALEGIDKQLKKNTEKDLVDHLLKEKEDICTKLDEINSLLNEKKDAIKELESSDGQTVPGLMCKMDVLKDDLIEKARELNYKSKMSEATTKASGKEKETLRNSLNSLNSQLAALEDSMDNAKGNYPFRGKKIKKQLPPEIASLLASKVDTELEREKIQEEITKTENEIGRCHRRLKRKRNRSQPFERKKSRLEKALQLVSPVSSEASELTPREIEDKATGDGEDNNVALWTANGNKFPGEDQTITEKQREIKRGIEDLNNAISNIDLPYELDQQLTDDSPTATKLDNVHQAKLGKEEDMKLLEAEIAVKQKELKRIGFDDPVQLFQYLEESEQLKKEIAKLDNSQLNTGSTAEAENYDQKELASLLLLRESLEEKIDKLDDEICEEQANFLDACQFKKTGNVDTDAESKIRKLIDSKEKLVTDLKDTNETILQSLSAGGLTGPHAGFLEECVERKVKLEEGIDKLQDNIDNEIARTAERLKDLLERKYIDNEELKKATENVVELVKRMQSKVSNDDEYNNNIPDGTGITSQAFQIAEQESATYSERHELREKQREIEEILKEKAESLIETKRRGQDPCSEEEALENAIREKMSVYEKFQEDFGDEKESSDETHSLQETKRQSEERRNKKGREKKRRKREPHPEIFKERAESSQEAQRQVEVSSNVEDGLENVNREKICVHENLPEDSEDETDGSKETASEQNNIRENEERRRKKGRKKNGRQEERDPGEKETTLERGLGENTSEEEKEDEDSDTAISLNLSDVRDKSDKSLECRHLSDDLDDKRRELEENLRISENALYKLLQHAGLSDDHENNDLENLKSLAAEKVKLEEELEQSRLLEDLLNKKQTLQKQLCHNEAEEDDHGRKAQLDSELEKLNALIKRRKSELQKIETKKEAKEETLKRLSEEKEKLDERLEPLNETINKARKDVETDIEEVQRNISENEKYSNEEQQALRQDLEVLHDDIERCKKEEQELEKELRRLKKESREPKGDVLDLEKLLIEKESLREYLAEIDATLDNSETDATEQETSDEIDELRENKRDLETKLEEIRNKKARLGVEFEDEEMDEALKDLAQVKNDLEEREREISDQIRDSGVLGKLAEKRKKHSSEIPRHYIQGILDEMAREEKTLTELIKDQEELKNAAQRQRDNLEDTIALVKSKVGEDLVNALASLSPDDIEPQQAESQYQSVIDEGEGNEATISDILEEIGEENRQLRVINDELSSELDALKEKIGEELVSELFSHALPIEDQEFGDVISSVKDDEKTLESILNEQKETIDAIEDTLGKGLFNSILTKEEKPDTGGDVYTPVKLIAPVIMKNYDEDLENVIAIYEKGLDKLSHENDVLKEHLGNDLSQEILKLSKRPWKPSVKDGEHLETPAGRVEDETPFDGSKPAASVKLEGQSPPCFEGLAPSSQEGKEGNDVIEDIDQETDRKAKESVKGHDLPKSGTREPEESKCDKAERTTDNALKKQQVEDDEEIQDTDTLPREENMDNAPRIYNIVSSYFGSPEETRPSVLTDEADGNVKGPFNAIKIMQDNGNTLGEIIAQYEHDLQRSPNENSLSTTKDDKHVPGGKMKQDSGKTIDLPRQQKVMGDESRGGVGLSDGAKPGGISEVEKTMQDIVEAQEKNMEMLRVLKERLGEDLVDALMSGTKEGESDDLLSDSVTTHEKEGKGELPEGEGLAESQDDNEGHLKEATTVAPDSESAKKNATEIREMPVSNDAVAPGEIPCTIVHHEEGDMAQKRYQEEDNTKGRKLKAPNIALENKETLADVIASYEKGMDSLQSKLGPSLTRTLLAMEDITVPEREKKRDQVEDTSEKECTKGHEERRVEEEDAALIETQDKRPALKSTDGVSSINKGLRAPDIMATSGKTLEEVLENYEQRITKEINQLEKEVSTLKEKLGGDLFRTLLTESNKEDALPQAAEHSVPEKERVDEPYSNATDPKSVAHEGDVASDELRAKSLLQGKGKTVEDILKGYEKQLEQLPQFPNENGDSTSILDLITNYDDKIAQLEGENKILADRLANLSERVGRDLMETLETMETTQKSNTGDAGGGVEEDGIQAPQMMKMEEKTLEEIVINYEKELDALRKMLPSQRDEGLSMLDVVKDYEDKLVNLENLKSKLGPSLTRRLLAMEDLNVPLLQEKLDQEEETSDKGGTKEHEMRPVEEKEEKHDELIENSDKRPELMSVEETSSIVKELRAPDIMATSGKTLEEVLEDYEQRIDEEVNHLEKEINILKEKLGGDLFRTFLTESNSDNVLPQTVENIAPSEETADEPYSKATYSKSAADEGDAPSGDLGAKSLLQEEGKTVEDILRSYEKQLEQLSKLVPNEQGDSASFLALISSYENKIVELKGNNKKLTDRLANLSESIGPDLMDKLESMETKQKSDTGDDSDGLEEDGIQATQIMKTEEKTLEKVVVNYEKELDALRKMVPSQGDEGIPISDVVKDYEDKIDDLKSRSNVLEEEHDRLVSKIGRGLVDDLMKLKSVDDGCDDEMIHHSDNNLEMKPEENKSMDRSRLNAPLIVNKEDSTLEDVLENYEKALGLLPRPPAPQDDDSVDNQLRTFNDLERENKILKDALGDELAENLIAQVDENVAAKPYFPERKLSSQEKVQLESRKQPHELDSLDGNDQRALELITDEGRTIANILKNYEKELEALRKLVPSGTYEGASVSELVRGYEDEVEKLENENKALSDMLNNLAKDIGPGLMDDLQSLKQSNKEYDGKYLDDRTPSDLEVPNLMQNENRTLEGVIRIYENELNALRKLVPEQGGEGSISDIIKEYEGKLEALADDNNNAKGELLDLQEKIGQGLVDDLNGLQISSTKGVENVTEKDDEKDTVRTKIILKAPNIMSENKLSLEDILAAYEDDLYNLEWENKIFREGLGKGMVKALLKMAKETQGSSPSELENEETNTQVPDSGYLETSSKLKVMMGDKTMEQSKDTISYAKGKGEGEARDDSKAGTVVELKAMNLMKDEGKDITKILEIYEKELDTLGKLAPGETDEGISVSDLIKDYENKIEEIERGNMTLEKKLQNLKKSVGQGLFGVLDNLESETTQQNRDDYPSDKEIDVDVVNVMRNEDRTLENVVKNYEKELSALRNLVPRQADGSSSLSDVIKEYEDKVEDLQRQNRDLKTDQDTLEEKIGCNLLDDLKNVYREKDDEGRISYGGGSHLENVYEKLRAPEIMKEKDLSLENVVASYEKDLDDLRKENTVLKEGLGPQIANTLLHKADRNEASALTDSDVSSDTVFTQGGKDHKSPTLSRKGRKGVKGGKKRQIETGNRDYGNERSSKPLDRNNNDDSTTAVGSGDLIAESLIKEEGRTVENILKNYEKQLEALTKLAPSDENVSISDLVTKYEDTIEGLEKENENLATRLEQIEQKIGSNLLNEVETKRVEGATTFEDNSDTNDERLMAPRIMEKEKRTLENVIKAYEKELDVLRDLIPSDGGEGNTIADIVKTYEDKLEQFRAENEKLKGDSERLQNRIGHDLVNDIRKLEEINVGATEVVASKAANDLKVTKIMDVKQSKLEDVLEIYESALGMLLSDTSTTTHDFNSEDFIDDPSNTIKELKQERDILKSSVGTALSQKLITFAKSEKGEADWNSDDAQICEQDMNADDGLSNVKGSSKDLGDATKDGNQIEVLSDTVIPPEELKAETLVREEGRTIENILKNYEKELETLKSLVLNGSGQPADTFSDLVRKYEDEKDELKKENRSLVERMAYLEGKIGPDLMNELENKQNSEESLDGVRGSELNAPVFMEEEDRTLEAVIKCYEKELDALRKLAPNQEKDQQVSISDIIKDYEDKLDQLNGETKTLKTVLDKLEDRLGSNLLEEVKRLDDETVECEIPSGANKIDGEAAGMKLKAPKIMQEESVTLENVLERYEDTLGFDLADTNSPNEEVDKKVSGHQLKTMKLKADRISDDFEQAIDISKEENETSFEEMELLKKKVGFDHAKELLRPKESDPGMKGRWEAVGKIKEEEKTLADILEIYERDLDRLKREKSAMEIMVRENDGDGQSALDIISQYEDEIEHLKHTAKQYENKLSMLFARVGDNLVNDILSMTPDKQTTLNCSLEALEIMAMQEKQLATVLKQYENDIRTLTRENEVLKVVASDVNVNGKSLTSLVSEYETKIQELFKEKQEAESSLRILSEKIGGSLVNEMLNPGEEGEAFPLDALKTMENENKTLSGVVEEYEEDLARMKREISALRDMVSEDSEKSSFMEKVSKYEYEISDLNNKIKAQALLEKKVGTDLSKQLTTLGEIVSEKIQGNITLKAVELMERDKDATLADVLKDYEENLEKKTHEILALKELISGDMLEIAASQESEIYELKKVKAMLAKELDLICDKVGKELTDELMKRSTQQPTTERGKLYQEVVQRMQNEGKPLENIINDYDKEIKLMRVKNEDLSKKEDILTEVSEKIGKDLVNDLLTIDAHEDTKKEAKSLFEAPQLMSAEEKTLAEVMLSYEKELAKLKREDGALRLLTEKETSQDTSVIDVLSDYEEKIEKLETERRELNKRMQKVTWRVGVELTEELLKLPNEVCKRSTEPVNKLNALRILHGDQATLTDVLESYEKKLREGEEANLGPLVSGQVMKEDIKLAQIVRVDEDEPEISISKEEPPDMSRYLKDAESDKTITPGPNAVDFEESTETTPLDYQEKIKKLADANTTLRKNLEQLSRKVGKELSQELMKSPEDKDNEVKAAVKFASVRDLDAFDDVIAERATLAQVLENYENKLKRTSQDDIGPLVQLGHIVEEKVKSAELVLANEGVEDICNIGETEIVSHYKVPASDFDPKVEEEVDGSTYPELTDLDLLSLEDLILEKPQKMAHPDESPPYYEGKQIIAEEMLKVEMPRHEESFNPEFMESLFASDIPVADKEEPWKAQDSMLPESKAEHRGNNKIETLEKKVKDLEKELEEEKTLKEKYEKDVQDLLKDIVDLKMKQAEDDDENPEETRRKIKEELDLKQDNKRLQEDLTKERKRRLSIEESKRDLLDEVDTLMREKETLLKKQNEPKDSDKLLEDMIGLRKKIGELDTKNKNLNKEVKELRESIKELEVCHEEEKSQLLANCETEKSEMMEELMTSKRELETQLQELLGMNDDLKGTIKNLLEELKESNERLVTEGETQNDKEAEDIDKERSDEPRAPLAEETQEKERNSMYEREKNENLKEQLDETEHALKQTLERYKDEIKTIETEKAKREDELRQEIDILTNKLELEKASAEQQRKDFDSVVQREKERLKEDMEIELEREKKKLKLDFEDREDEFTRQGRKRSTELQEQEELWNKEREEMQEIFRIEKEKLRKSFDEELQSKIAEKDKEQRQRNEQMNRDFAKEKKEIKASVEKKIYEKLIDKNVAAETDFQEVLSKILQDHSKEIEGVENDIRKAEEMFKEDKNKLLEQNDKEKEALKKLHEEEKKALESTVQNLLKEVVKLKHQRKEIRIIHKKEKESMEEIYERDRVKLKEDWEQYKRDLLNKLQEEFDNKLANETTKLETRLEDLKRELEKSEQRRKELEERLKGIPRENEQQRFDEGVTSARADLDKEEHLKELKSAKKTLEEEYEKKLKEEKRKFEETLQGLRREIGSLQEKRRVIQDKLYNQDPSVMDRHLMEKSLANYKLEMLAKMEEEVAQKISREKKPLEETIKELQLENEELKRQRWELRNQLRRERSKLEEEFELERENIENQFLKEKEELKSKLESRIQREIAKRSMEDKVSRALSPISNVSIS